MRDVLENLVRDGKVRDAKTSEMPYLCILDPWIIEEIKRREEEKQQDDRPVIELPVYTPQIPETEQSPEENETPRGVVIINMMKGYE